MQLHFLQCHASSAQRSPEAGVAVICGGFSLVDMADPISVIGLVVAAVDVAQTVEKYSVL